MSGSGINMEENLNRLDEFHIYAHLHVKPARVLTPHGTLVDMPLDSPEEALVWYARCYIMYLLGGVLLPDKANNTVHVRYLPLLANYEAISTYSWGSAVMVGGAAGKSSDPCNIDRFNNTWDDPFALNRLGFRNNLCFLSTIILNLVFLR
ncbi:hypothetical protein Ahy_A08g040838 [Arachis hypogaea]|uniref:Aminotransferase-like plant mobile domain-containing protein n=1 Tax=Arachis hypogaea TaxID=3818 RepID=A0A445C0S2_ARAHY|nr:hypothetical protein Ahy_A08g040838 [Arachis hypogaea]